MHARSLLPCGPAATAASASPGSTCPYAWPLQEHLFELGDRGTVLQELDKPSIIPHIAEQEGKRFLYEVIFKWVPGRPVLRGVSGGLGCSCVTMSVSCGKPN